MGIIREWHIYASVCSDTANTPIITSTRIKQSLTVLLLFKTTKVTGINSYFICSTMKALKHWLLFVSESIVKELEILSHLKVDLIERPERPTEKRKQNYNLLSSSLMSWVMKLLYIRDFRNPTYKLHSEDWLGVGGLEVSSTVLCYSDLLSGIYIYSSSWPAHRIASGDIYYTVVFPEGQAGCYSTIWHLLYIPSLVLLSDAFQQPRDLDSVRKN